MCRNLNNLIEKSARALRLPISTTPAPIKTSRRGRPLKSKVVDYPLLRPPDWMQCIFRAGGHFLLAGQSLDEIESFGDTHQAFWSRYSAMEPQFMFEGNVRMAIPYALHGDEGRGQGKKPVLVLSLQPLITSADMSKTNMSGYLVYRYAKPKS